MFVATASKHSDTMGGSEPVKDQLFRQTASGVCNPLMDKRLAVDFLRQKNSICPLLLPNGDFWVLENRFTLTPAFKLWTSRQWLGCALNICLGRFSSIQSVGSPNTILDDSPL